MRLRCFIALVAAGTVLTLSLIGCSGGGSPIDPNLLNGTHDALSAALANVDVQNTDFAGVKLNGISLIPWGIKDVFLAQEGTFPLEIVLSNADGQVNLTVSGADLLMDGRKIDIYSGPGTTGLEIKPTADQIVIHLELPGKTVRTKDITVRVVPDPDLPIPARLGTVKYSDPISGQTVDIAERELQLGVVQGTPVAIVEALVNALDCEILRYLPETDVYRIRIPVGAGYAQFTGLFKESSIVRFCEVNPIFYTCLVPNDTYQGQEYENSLCDMHEAWDLTTGTSATTIAVIDSGIMRDHPDLAANVIDGEDFISPTGDGLGGATPGDGLDNNNDGVPDQNVEHGTHCAGIAGAIGNNSEGVSGHSWSTKLLPLRVFPVNGDDGAEDSAIQEAILYAANHDADVITMSLGSPYSSDADQAAIDFAWNAGLVVVAAAGNNDSSYHFYPAAYDHVVSVAATDSSDHRASFSNYGDWVDVSAPGVEIISSIFYEYVGDPESVPENQRYAVYQGTSMACPQVAGLVALVKSYLPFYTNAELVDQVVYSADNIDAANPSYAGLLGSGRINDYRALTTLLQPDFSIVAASADDDQPLFSQGNRDGFLNAGETIEFKPSVRNIGLKGAPDCFMSVIADPQYVRVLNSVVDLGYFEKGTTIVPDRPVVFRIEPDVADNTSVDLTIRFTFLGGDPIDIPCNIMVRNDLGVVDTVTCSGGSMLGDDIAKGMLEIPALRFTIEGDQNYATLDKLVVHQTGTAGPEAFGEVQLWLDSNQDGSFSTLFDARLAYQSYEHPGYRGNFDDLNDGENGFASGVDYEPLPPVYFDGSGEARFSEVQLPTAPGTPRSVFVVINITTEAVSGTTAQFGVLSPDDVIVKSPDVVSMDGFPIQTDEVPIVGRWLDPIQVTQNPDSTDSRNSWRAETAVDNGTGNLYMAFNANPYGNYDVYMIRSMNQGATFEDPVIMDSSFAQEYYPDIAVDSKGWIHVVYYSTKVTDNNREIFYVRSKDNGVSFESPVRLTNATRDSRIPKIAVGPDDSLNVAWHDNRLSQNNYDIFFMKSTDGGDTWEDTVQVCSTTSSSEEVEIAVGGDGVIHITWEELGFGYSGNTFYSGSTDGGETFSAPFKITSGSYNNRGWHSDVCADDSGQVYVVFQYVPGSSDAEIGMRISHDSGANWDNVQLITDNNIPDSRPGISVRPDGEYVDLVFRRLQAEVWNIYHMYSDDGMTSWATPVKISASVGGDAREAVVVRDSNFNIFSFWEDIANSKGDYEVFFNRFIY